LDSYTQGSRLELDERFEIVNTYNRTNAIILTLLLDPGAVESEELQAESRQLADQLGSQVEGSRTNDVWAWADLGLLSLLTGQFERAGEAYDRFKLEDERKHEARESTVGLLKQCREKLLAVKPELAAAIEARIKDLEGP